MAFVLRETFWEQESQAPLLTRNAGYLEMGKCDTATDRAKTWVDKCESELAEEGEPKDITKFKRIYRADAERTFQSEEFRTEIVALLEKLGLQVGDYHQGMGYVTSFLSLVLPEPDVYKILLRMTNEKYMAGYFKGQAATFVRDANVLQRLVDKHHPDLGKHLSDSGAAPVAYASKWFVGLCVHVLPYEALFRFIEEFMERGSIWLFQFALALISTLSDKLLDAGRDVSRMFSLLRLDSTIFPDKNIDFFHGIIDAALEVELDAAMVAELRDEEWAKLQEHLERVRQRELEMAEEESEDECSLASTTDDEDEETKDEK